MKKICLFLSLLLSLLFHTKLKAQLSASDSAYFQNIFTNNLYMDTTLYSGNWYQYNPITTMYEHYLILDTNFKFKTQDLDSISYLTIDDSLHYDTPRNTSFNQYPTLMNQTDPIVFVPYTFLNKHSRAYAIRHRDTLNTSCRNAFLIIPGTGVNASKDIVNGVGYHNQLCLMKNNCMNYGDVYTFMKPNEESRAVYWNNKKLNEYIVNYLITQNTRYGINYVIEMIAMVKYLKANYDKVFLFGLSEGGYSALLTTMFIEPDAAMISGGYSIHFDTCTIEKDILKTRFDYLLDTFDKVKVKDKVTNSTTQYLFTWGDGDPVLTMDPEHDFHYTQNYFGPLPNCNYFYDFLDHTFPPCYNIDTFVQRILDIPYAHYTITDSSLVDTMFTKVQFCRAGSYSFDLFKDGVLHQTYTQITDSLIIPLTDTGFYSIHNIVDSNAQQGKCIDSIYCTKYPISIVTAIPSIQDATLLYSNPFHDFFRIQTNKPSEEKFQMYITDMMGVVKYASPKPFARFELPTSTWATGCYLLYIEFQNNKQRQFIKLIKH